MPSFPDEPDFVLPRPRAASRPRVPKSAFLAGLIFLLFLVAHNAVPLYTDWLWFGEAGYRNVFTTTIAAKTGLFFAFGSLFFTLLFTNLQFARRLAPEKADRFLRERFGPVWAPVMQRGLGWIILAVTLFFSLWAGRLAADNWTQWLEFSHATPFGTADPVFHHDIGFYVFQLPFWSFAVNFLLTTLILTFAGVVAVHVTHRAIDTFAGLPDIAPKVKGQLLILLAAIALTYAVDTRLGSYDLLTSDNGVFSGAGYADLHYRLPILNLQIILLIATALACLVSLRRRSLRWVGLGVGAWLFTGIVIGGVVPGALEKLYVEPNQFTMERDYIARNIRYTRQGFGLDNVQRVNSFAADESLTASGLRANRDTLDNVRLWDYQYLGKLYGQLQTVKNYYKFEQTNVGAGTSYNLDIDRYTIGGRVRQVMLAAREMNPNGLPTEAQTWQNQRLGYTHGYGLVVSPVNRIAQEGPEYFEQGFPPVATKEANALQVTQPQIYYGLLSHDYVFVDTAQQEFDYPATDSNQAGGGTQDHYTTYAGKGGIRIGDSYLKRLAFSLRLGDQNILLANGFKPETRILFRRDVRERVLTVAPFLQQDTDPYLVVNPDNGRLVWMLDGYTLSDRYPYSTRQDIAVNPIAYIAPNYIRNSVKAVVDAYDGSINLYVSDAKDPIVRTYAKIFPGLLKPLSALPSGLRAHLRYPEDLFRMQRSVYAAYHVDDPRVFYLKEDAWAIPTEPNPDAAQAQPNVRQMEPYYVVMRLPAHTTRRGEAALREEFLLMSPLAPINKESQNILGWMCARCDGDNYGQLVLYRFPQNRNVAGPTQVVSRIDSDPVISPRLTLLRSGGSTAKFGNVIVIPVENSLLYITPLYVESSASESKLPQLQAVVVAYGDRVAIGDTLDAALTQLFPGYGNGSETETEPRPSGTPTNATQAPTSGPTGTVTPALRQLIGQATAQYESAQTKLKAGDFAGYGAATKQLEATLNALRQSAGR